MLFPLKDDQDPNKILDDLQMEILTAARACVNRLHTLKTVPNDERKRKTRAATLGKMLCLHDLVTLQNLPCRTRYEAIEEEFDTLFQAPEPPEEEEKHPDE